MTDEPFGFNVDAYCINELANIVVEMLKRENKKRSWQS